MKLIILTVLAFLAGWGSALGGKIGLDLSMRLNARSYELGCLLVAKDGEFCANVRDIYYEGLISE